MKPETKTHMSEQIGKDRMNECPSLASWYRDQCAAFIDIDSCSDSHALAAFHLTPLAKV